MPRKRNPENKGLPERWQKAHGAFYYQVPLGKEHLWDGKKKFPLGKTLPEAYRAWADRIGDHERRDTVSDLLERYEREVIPTNKPKTRREKVRYAVKLRTVLGDMPIAEITPPLIYGYYDRRSKKGGPVIAKREIALLSHAYTKAVQWGYIGRHPFKGEVRLKGEKSRTRYVEDWEIEECLALPMPKGRSAIKVIRAYIKLKILVGLRQCDLLRLRATDIKDDGLHVKPSKTENSTGKSLIFTWTDELRAAVREVLAARPVDISPWLFCTARGECYYDEETGEASGWKSNWQRFMARVLKETKVDERFTEHDIRAKTGSDSDSDQSASERLGHADVKITKKVYRRKAAKVSPLR